MVTIETSSALHLFYIPCVYFTMLIVKIVSSKDLRKSVQLLIKQSHRDVLKNDKHFQRKFPQRRLFQQFFRVLVSIFNNLKNLKYQRTSAGNKLQRLMKDICAFDAKNLTLYTRKIHDVHLLLFIKSNKKSLQVFLEDQSQFVIS